MAAKLSAGDVAIQILSHYAVPFVSAREEKVEVATQLIDQAITGATLRVQEYAVELVAENRRLHRIEEQRNEFEQLANAYRIKFETAEARLTAAREVLRKYEWAGFSRRGSFCLHCFKYEVDGHLPDCELDAVLNNGGANDGR